MSKQYTTLTISVTLHKENDDSPSAYQYRLNKIAMLSGMDKSELVKHWINTAADSIAKKAGVEKIEDVKFSADIVD